MTTPARRHPHSSEAPTPLTRTPLTLIASSARRPTWPVDDDWIMPHDTTRSIVGTDLHQEVISNVADSLRIALEDNDPRPWTVSSQTSIRGFINAAQESVDCSPDVYVYDRVLPKSRAMTYLHQEGPPVLTIEVYSPSTGRKDLDDQKGKAWTYGYGWRGGGVQEYLVFESAGEVLPDQVQAWHRDEHGNWTEWPPELDSGADPQVDRRRWRSRTGVSFAVEGLFLRVYDAVGERIMPPREAPPAIVAARAAAAAEREARLREEAARQAAEAENERLRAEIERLRQQLDH